MRKVVFWLGISLDGYFEGPDHDISWHCVDAELHQYMNDELGAMGGFLEGRVTYELMAEFWPTADQRPDAEPQIVEFARIWRDMPKVVYSRTLQAVDDPNATIARDVQADEVAALKQQAGGDLVVGGPNLAATFMRLGLVDEYRVFIHPAVIGAGKTMFPPDVHLDLQLIETLRFGNGVVCLQYEPRHT